MAIERKNTHMKNIKILSLIFQALVILLLTSCNLGVNHSKTADLAKGDDEFSIKRGVNISHWLSQSKRKGEQRASFITEKDFGKISSLGYDHVRLPLDEMHLWSETGEKDQEAFQLVHNAIKWCKNNNLKVIADLHVVRSHYFNANYNPLWDDVSEQEKFIGFWKQISAELDAYPNNLVAYELLNEPVANNTEDWNNLIAKTMNVIRENEPNRTVIIGSNKWQSVDTFDQLILPENDKHIILSFHFYSPHVFTHYKAPWSRKVGYYTGPVHYPGHPLKPIDLVNYDSIQVKKLTDDDGDYNKDFFFDKLQQPLLVSKKYGLKLFCGEFGCYPTTDLNDRVAWYSDLTQVFEENNIAWANWDYKGDFGILDKETGLPREEIINALFKKSKL